MGKIATRFSIVQFGLTIFKATPNAEKPFEVHHRFVESTRSLRPPPPAILHPLYESRSPSSCFPHEVTHGTKCILDEECGFPYPQRQVTPCILPKNSNQIFTYSWTTIAFTTAAPLGKAVQLLPVPVRTAWLQRYRAESFVHRLLEQAWYGLAEVDCSWCCIRGQGH